MDASNNNVSECLVVDEQAKIINHSHAGRETSYDYDGVMPVITKQQEVYEGEFVSGGHFARGRLVAPGRTACCWGCPVAFSLPCELDSFTVRRGGEANCLSVIHVMI